MEKRELPQQMAISFHQQAIDLPSYQGIFHENDLGPRESLEDNLWLMASADENTMYFH